MLEAETSGKLILTRPEAGTSILTLEVITVELEDMVSNFAENSS